MEKITSPTLVYHWVHPWLGWCEMTLEWLMDGFWHWGYIIIGIAGKSGVPFSMAVGNCPQDFIHFYSILQWTFIDRCGKPRCEAIVLSMYIYIYWRWFGWKFQALLTFKPTWYDDPGVREATTDPLVSFGGCPGLRQWGLWRGAYRWEPLGTWEPWDLHQNWWYLGVR